MTPLVKASQAALLDAARAYADATSRGEGERTEGLYVAARLRLAAKAFRQAEREASAR